MIVDILTIFPEMFPAPMGTSMLGLAQERGALTLRIHDLRDWTHDRHRSTDDAPYGGGAGMVMKPEPIFEAVEAIQALGPAAATVVFLTPVGSVFSQAIAQDLSTHERLLLVCGRYEGFDERVLGLANLRISLGDYVLTGGELPAMVLTDAIVRLLPGVLGDETSAVDESFAEGLLEYPQYTRPAEFRGERVPDVLLSGDHARIARWRREQAVRLTARLRPDLLAHASLTPHELDIARECGITDDTSAGEEGTAS